MNDLSGDLIFVQDEPGNLVSYTPVDGEWETVNNNLVTIFPMLRLEDYEDIKGFVSRSKTISSIKT